ncbi:MAG: hypothetical protein ABW128_17010, partial [Rhizorhabdus sp.]
TQHDSILYRDDTTSAALAAGKPKWDLRETINALGALSPGDELSLGDNVSIIVLSGKDVSL